MLTFSFSAAFLPLRLSLRKSFAHTVNVQLSVPL